ncbi:MAG: hypothetical protein WCL27_06695 [Betaproteobacteria bacterium]
MLKRADGDDTRVIQDALINHSNAVHSVANHTTQLIERLRFYSQTLAVGEANESTQKIVRSALIQDKSFLRVMHFDGNGKLLFSSGRKPESWIIDTASEFAKKTHMSNVEEMVIGAVPPHEYAHVWSLPIIFQPILSGATSASFTIALLDMGYFSKHFENIKLGKSGEIVLVTNDGRELLRLHGSHLDSVESIVGTERFRQAFALSTGSVTEQLANNHVRLYAFQRIPSSPLAALVSRTRYDVLQGNQIAQRGYWGVALLLTLLMLFLTFLWMKANYRRQSLIHNLTLAQENNLHLINQIEREKEVAYHMASHDKLTGLPNRMLFSELANRYVGRAKRARVALPSSSLTLIASNRSMIPMVTRPVITC